MNTAEYLLGAGRAGEPAVIDQAGVHSYGELRGVVSAMIEHLDRMRLPPGAVAALYAPNGVFWVAAYLAALARGLVVAPMPTALTPAEVAARTVWLDSNVVFVGRRLPGSLAEHLPASTAVVSEATLLAERPGSAPELPAFTRVDPDADAVYEFTSGTTGQPRVVRLTHRNLQANTDSILAYLELTSADRALVVLPFTYVFGASLLHTHLRVGAAMVLQNTFVYPEAVVERMIAERCTVFAGVPSTFHLLLRNSSFSRRAVPSLRMVQQAGGKLSPVLIRELTSAQPQAQIYVMYGQTEATARLSYLPPAEVLDRIGSIGRGIPGVQLSVVAADGTPVAPGEVGEIRARGASISPGYLGDPEATAQKMPSGELRTGDLATVDADGYIYIVDRAEDFIKSWGHRIASQDIEAAAMELTELVAAAAVGVPDEAAGERVELVVVPRPGSLVDAAAVLAHCRARLAKHMVPQAVRLVDRLPLNANGKVAKRELRSWCAEQAPTEAGTAEG